MKTLGEKKLSIFRLVCREFDCAIRRQLARGTSELEIFQHLVAGKARILKKLTTYGGVLLVCAIAISNLSDGKALDFRIGGVSLKIPDIYIAFVGASAIAGIVYLTLQMIVYVTVQADFEQKPKRLERFYGAELSLIGDENSDLTSPIRVGHFIKHNGWFKLIATSLYLIPVLLGLMPIGVATFLILNEALDTLTGQTTVFAARSLSVVSLFLIVPPLLYLICFFIPVRSYKDAGFIRWSFLVHATRGNSRQHHNSERWLSDRDK